MVDFVNEIPDASEPASAFSSTVNPVFARSFSATLDTPNATYVPPIGHQAFNEQQVAEVPQQSFMSLGQLSREYATYLLLNQFGFDNSTIMAAAAFQKAFPLPTGSQITPSSLASLLPYAMHLDTNNLLGNLQLLQAAITAMEHQQQMQTQQQIPPLTFGASSAATCASSVIALSESPVNETNNNLTINDVKQQFLPTSPSTSPIDESLQNSISRNKLGRSYNPGRPLAMADRQRILDLYKKGYKISHIARIIGVTHSCVSKIMTKFRQTGSMHPRSTQIPRKNSSNSSPTRSSTSPFSVTEASSIFTNSSMELSDSASSTCSFLVPQTPIVVPQTTSPLLFNGITGTSSSSSTTDSQMASLLIHKPVPVKMEYCVSS